MLYFWLTLSSWLTKPPCAFSHWLMLRKNASLVAQRLKHLPGMWETWVQSLGREDPLEKEMATHSSTLAWRIPWREEPGRLQSMGSQRVGHDWVASFTSLTYVKKRVWNSGRAISQEKKKLNVKVASVELLSWIEPQCGLIHTPEGKEREVRWRVKKENS